MGAWGLGLFESDHDFDSISYMYDPAGLEALEGKAKERAAQKKSQSKQAGATKPAGTDKSASASEGEDRCTLSLFSGHCDDVDLVRDHLDSGALGKLIGHYKAAMDEKSQYLKTAGLSDHDEVMGEDARDRAVYDFVLLGACAMSLGCKIPSDYKELMIKLYRTTQFQRDARGQLQVALGDGPNRYKDGVAHQFAGLGELPGDREREDRIYPNGRLINVWAPFGMLRDTRVEKREYPAGVCGGCGAKDRLDGEPLLSCGKCKTKKYCGRVCQQAHFKQHKRVCKPQ